MKTDVKNVLTNKTEGVEEKVNNLVNHPAHYTKGKVECIDAIQSMVESYEDPWDSFLSGQVLKYIWRHPFKENPAQDIKKAIWYAEQLVEHLESKKNKTGE